MTSGDTSNVANPVQVPVGSNVCRIGSRRAASSSFREKTPRAARVPAGNPRDRQDILQLERPRRNAAAATYAASADSSFARVRNVIE